MNKTFTPNTDRLFNICAITAGIVFSVMTVSAIGGCSDGVKVAPKDAQDIVNKMTYVKDRHGLCYAVAMSNNTDMSASYSMANVPCDKVGL